MKYITFMFILELFPSRGIIKSKTLVCENYSTKVYTFATFVTLRRCLYKYKTKSRKASAFVNQYLLPVKNLNSSTIQ